MKRIVTHSRRSLLSAAPLAAGLFAAPSSAQGSNRASGHGGGELEAKDFGAVGDGLADDTQALVALFRTMAITGRPGRLGGNGATTRYLVQAGALVWEAVSTSENTAGPTILTSGRVILLVKPGSPDLPIIYIHNERTKGGRFVHGGYIGPLEFSDTSNDTAEKRHGLQLCGVQFMTIAPLFSEALKGDLVHIERRGGETTADAWHVAGNRFEGLTTWNTGGWTLNNDSLSQVFNGNELGMLWSVNCAKGVWRGPGAANHARFLSCGGNEGWAIDWQPSGAAGSVQTNVIEAAELDGPEYGIRLNGVEVFTIDAVRIVHRYREHPRQGSSSSPWPKVAVQVGGPQGLSTLGGKIRVFHYLKEITPDLVSRLGTFVDFQNDPTTRLMEIENIIIAAFPNFSPNIAKFASGRSPHSSNVLVTVNGAAVP